MVNKAIQTVPVLCHISTQTSNELNHNSAQIYIDSKSANLKRNPSFVAQCPQLADLIPAAAIVRYSASDLTDEAIKFYTGLPSGSVFQLVLTHLLCCCTHLKS